MITAKQVPYTGPYSNAHTKLPSRGPTVVALKRALVRVGVLEPPSGGMTGVTDLWPRPGAFDEAYRAWELSCNVPADGVYGRQEWKAMREQRVPPGRPHAGEYALDRYARKLIRDEWEAEHVPDEEDVRAALTRFTLLAEKNEPNWHYRLARPLDVSVEPTASYIVSDCSMYVIQAYHWAGVQTGLAVPDPSKQGYSGYGNTDLYEDDHPRATTPFRVGDLAHYSGHVTLCRMAGDAQTAVFSSHGKEAGPIPASLHYRSDLRFVVRPPLT